MPRLHPIAEAAAAAAAVVAAGAAGALVFCMYWWYGSLWTYLIAYAWVAAARLFAAGRRLLLATAMRR